MTEEEWQAATDPRQLVAFVQGRVSDRKLTYFVAGCFRDAVATGRVSRPGREAAERWDAAERFADGAEQVEIVRQSWPSGLASDSRSWPEMPQFWAEQYVRREREGPKYRRTAHIFRDIFGNPFRPVAVDPSWLTPTVVALAEAIYADRAFDRMPILADALEEAGCDHPDVLAHCRGDGPHVRGCWVVDLVLGKG